jgi:hypothetical protein
MKEQSIEKLIERFTTAAKKHFTASLAGDWRSANKEAKVIRKTARQIFDLGEDARKALLAQTDNEDLYVSALAAVYSLKFSPDKSISILTKISKEPGLVGFEAKQALLRWEQGEWMLDK